jgi:hypothetical protein
LALKKIERGGDAASTFFTALFVVAVANKMISVDKKMLFDFGDAEYADLSG